MLNNLGKDTSEDIFCSGMGAALDIYLVGRGQDEDIMGGMW